MAAYKIDNTHSEISFSVRHMMFAKVRGQFKTWTATIGYDPAEPTKLSTEVAIDAASIDTGVEQRDGHLRSGDFFNVEKFPKLIFKSKRFETVGGSKYKLVGDLTIRDATREIVLDVEQTGGGKDPWGNQRVGFQARATLIRSEWGLTWNQALESGGVLVSDKVELEVEVQVVEQK